MNPMGVLVPGFSETLRSQARIWCRAPLLVLPVAAVIYVVLAVGLQMATGTTTWADSLSHLNMWVVAVGPLFVAVQTGTMATLDRRARSGGVDFRAVPPATLRNARLVVTATWCLLAHAAVVVATCAAGIAAAQVGVGTAVLDGARLLVVLWVSYLGYCAVLTVAGEIAGMAGCVAAGLVFSALGTLYAESPSWYLVPPAWIVRPALPLIGTHANGVGLGGDRIAHGWVAVLLGALVAVAVLLLAPGVRSVVESVRYRLPGRLARSGRGGRDRLHNSPIRALTLILRSSWVGALVVGALAAVIVTQQRYQPGVAYEFFALLVLPMGCAVLPAIWIPRLRNGFRALAVRTYDPRKLVVRLTLILLSTESVVCVVVGAGAILAGQRLGLAVQCTFVSAVIGAMLVMLGAAVTAAAGRSAGLLVGVVGTVFGSLVGGSGLAGQLGPVVPWAWAVLLTPARAIVTIPIAAVVAIACALLANRAFTRQVAGM
ncbi:hypothetical protein K7711_00710 [Nocardia sp. CA2R105]|uniref:hypothetical protein n=1 Tax=Nocardia coffeae TaxID=2873381 RepID=UPI001CA77B6D|nr:hypothetical protein [Nocardia coffeae]MBY8854991.1 hypothetical protein [Nocardia coffeae]